MSVLCSLFRSINWSEPVSVSVFPNMGERPDWTGPSSTRCCRSSVSVLSQVIIVIYIIQQSNKCKRIIQSLSCSGPQYYWTYLWCSQATLPDSRSSTSLSPWLSGPYSCCSVCPSEFHPRNQQGWRCNTHRCTSSNLHFLSFCCWWWLWQWFHHRRWRWSKFRGKATQDEYCQWDVAKLFKLHSRYRGIRKRWWVNTKNYKTWTMTIWNEAQAIKNKNDKDQP